MVRDRKETAVHRRDVLKPVITEFGDGVGDNPLHALCYHYLLEFIHRPNVLQYMREELRLLLRKQRLRSQADIRMVRN